LRRVSRYRPALETGRQSAAQRADGRLGPETGKIEGEHAAAWLTLETEWKRRTVPLYETKDAAIAFAEKLFPAWSDPAWAKWTPPARFGQAAKFADLEVDLEKLCDKLPKPGSAGVSVGQSLLILPAPPLLPPPLLATGQAPSCSKPPTPGHDQAVAALNNIILRLLSVARPDA